MVITEGQDGDEGTRRQVVMRAEAAAVVDDEGGVAHLQRVAEERADIFHAGIGKGIG